MFWRCCIVFVLFSRFAVGDDGGTLESIRQQFGIYQRFSGEIEILSTDNTVEIDNALKRTETKRLAVRKELDKALTEQKPIANLPSPLFAEEYAAPFLHYVVVERAFAARSLEQGKPDDAISSIRCVYQLADVLSESRSLELRIAAAQFRLRMLETAQSILLHPLCKHEHHELLFGIFEEQINKRTTDSEIWTRYRVEGKQFYADLLKHGLDKMIAPKLLKELEERHAFREYVKNPSACVEQDQANYLKACDAVIESCSVPYFKRQPILRQLDEEMKEQQGTATEPVFTILLLRDVSSSMRSLAQERSGIETAYLALSASLGKRNQQKVLNFLTGNQYETHLITDGVMCTYKGNVKPFYVPYR
jgi:hypothetical protein